MNRRRILLIALAFVFLCAIVLPLALVSRTARTDFPLPNPNGYDDFLAAGQMLVPVNGIPSLSPRELRSAVEQNSNALQRVREGLAKESRVAVTYDDQWFGATHLPQLSNFKAVSQLFAAEGALHESEGRTNAAAASYLDGVKFGGAIGHGGLMIHDMIASACQSICLNRLARVVPHLEQQELHSALKQLAAIDAARESAEAIIRRDRQWARRAHGAVRTGWAELLTWKIRQKADARFRDGHDRATALFRVVTAQMAVQAFERKHSRPPDDLAELVPDYLPSLPLDPFTQRALVYRRATNSFVLYSVGHDGKDDGGRPLTRGERATGDLLPPGR